MAVNPSTYIDVSRYANYIQLSSTIVYFENRRAATFTTSDIRFLFLWSIAAPFDGTERNTN